MNTARPSRAGACGGRCFLNKPKHVSVPVSGATPKPKPGGPRAEGPLIVLLKCPLKSFYRTFSKTEQHFC